MKTGGIAKGIRRVTCLTGAAAKQAMADGEAFRVRIAAAFALKPAEMMKEQKEMQTALSGLVCSYYLKEEFMAELKKCTKLVAKQLPVPVTIYVKLKQKKRKLQGK